MEEQRNDRLITNQWYKFYCRKYIVDKKITNSYKKAPETSPKIGSEESVVSLIMFHFRLQRWKSFGFWLCRRLQTNRWLISKNFTSSHFVILPNKYFLKWKVLDSTRKKQQNQQQEKIFIFSEDFANKEWGLQVRQRIWKDFLDRTHSFPFRYLVSMCQLRDTSVQFLTHRYLLCFTIENNGTK